MVALDKSQRVTKVITNHPKGSHECLIRVLCKSV